MVDTEGDLFFYLRLLQEGREAHLDSWHKILGTSDKRYRYLTFGCSLNMARSTIVCTV